MQYFSSPKGKTGAAEFSSRKAETVSGSCPLLTVSGSEDRSRRQKRRFSAVCRLFAREKSASLKLHKTAKAILDKFTFIRQGHFVILFSKKACLPGRFPLYCTKIKNARRQKLFSPPRKEGCLPNGHNGRGSAPPYQPSRGRC